ncbi:MAG: 30S ribosomal protein S16 [Actinomycetales bacterium]|nr:30S ribosomal protein S16 [Actinomycetales bacterium]
MATKIRLKRFGKKRAPFYRVVVADSRTKRDGRVIEEIGKYHPTEEPSLIEIDSERAQYWLGVGAQPSEQVAALLKITGDWQKFKGLPGAEGTLRTKGDKVDAAEAIKAAADAAEKVKAKAAEQKASEEKAAEAPAAEAPAEETVADEAAEEAPAQDEQA